MLVVSPNLGFDHTVRLDALAPGEVVRTGPGSTLAGGKGANVARAATGLGGRVRVTSLLPEVGRGWLRELFAAENLTLDGIEIPGAVRTCTILLESTGRVTVLNEPGALATTDDWDRLRHKVSELLQPGELLVCSGSLPPGSPDDAYAALVELGHQRGSEVLVDAATDALAHALRAGADLLCPNLSEAEGMLHGASSEAVDDEGDDVPERALAAAVALLEVGARQAVVTAGAAGIAYADAAGSHFLPTVRVQVRNPIGAGDSFVAGTGVAREAGDSWPDAVRKGMAAASASVESEGAGVVDPVRAAELDAQLAGS